MSKYVLPDGVEVKEVQVKMYTYKGSGFNYQDEESAKYAAAIGRVCECGKFISGKTYTYCLECRERRNHERYLKLKEIEWDGETPLVLFGGDEYFFSSEDIESYCDETDIDEKDLDLVICKPPTVSFDLEGLVRAILPQDWGINDINTKKADYLAEELEELVNKWLKDVSPISWIQGNKRITL